MMRVTESLVFYCSLKLTTSENTLKYMYTVVTLIRLFFTGDTNKINEILKQMNSFYKESLEDLVKAKDYLLILREISLTVISLRLHIALHENKGNLKEELVSCSEEIMTHLQSQYQKPILKVLGEFIKANVP